MSGEQWGQIVQAVHVMYDAPGTVDEELRSQATQYCHNFLQQPNAWVLCAEHLSSAPSLQVSIFCLSAIEEAVLHNFGRLDLQQRSMLRQVLLFYLRNIVTSQPDVAIRNKFAKCLVTLFRSEYPESWPGFFHDLLSTTGYIEASESKNFQVLVPATDIILRILLEIDNLVVVLTVTGTDHQRLHNQTIKDKMKEDCLPWATDLWHNTLSNSTISPSPPLSPPPFSPQLIFLAEDVIGRYIPWVDINLVTNDKFLPLFYHFLGSEIGEVREGAAMCLSAIVVKGMSSSEKLKLLRFLRLKEVLYRVAGYFQSDEIDFLCDFGKLANLYGSECLKCFESKDDPGVPREAVMAEAWELLEEIIPLCVEVLMHDFDDVSETCFPFILEFVNSLRHLVQQKEDISPKQQETVSQLFGVVQKKIKYEEEFDFASPRAADDEAIFKMFRGNVSRLFKSCASLAPVQACSFVHSLLPLCTLNNPFAEVEGFLTLLHALPEGLSDAKSPPQDVAVFFQFAISSIIHSNVISYNNGPVKLACLEVMQRFAKYIPTEPPELFREFIFSLLDERTIRSPNPTVRCRSAYQLMKICTTVKGRLDTSYVEKILTSLAPLLSVPLSGEDTEASLLDISEKRYLYETCSALLSLLPPEGLSSGSEIVLSPVMSQVREALSPESGIVWTPILQRHFEDLVSLLGHFLKGFSNPQEHVDPIFLAIVESSLQMLERVSTSSMRSQVLLVLHRAVDCLKDRFFNFLPTALNQLFRVCEKEDFKKVLSFLKNLTSRFREQAQPVLETVFDNVFKAGYTFLQENVTPGSDEERELHDIQFDLFYFLSHLTQNGLAGVIIGYAQAEAVLTMILTTMSHPTHKTNRSVKLAISIYQRLIEQSKSPESPEHLRTHIFQSALPASMQCLFDPRLDVTSHLGRLAVLEIVKLHISMFDLYGDYFLVEGKKILESLSVPYEIRETYLSKVAEKNQKELGAWIKTALEALMKGG